MIKQFAKEVTYTFGPYAFNTTRTGKIVGLCNQKFANENELLKAYDSVARGGWQLIKYSNGSKSILRGTDVSDKYVRIAK